MNKEFEKKLPELGFTYQILPNNKYKLISDDIKYRTLDVQLIFSEPVNESKLGSKNGNKIQAIGFFKLILMADGIVPDFFIFGFKNTDAHKSEYIIIPYQVIKERLFLKNVDLTYTRTKEILFWLMPDNGLFQTTNISAEGEYYYLSKGINGRMEVGTERDYTEFFNNWSSLKIIH